MASLTHLTKRFLGSLWPAGPGTEDRAWVDELLTASEAALWSRMSAADRRHAVAVARRVERALGHEASREVLVAALLHDVGKTVARLGTYGRVVATVSAAAAGRDTAYLWSEGRGFTRRVGLYLRHDELGGDLLAMAGSAAVVVAWAREHHLPEERWTVPPEVGSVLKDADDD